MPVDPVSVTTIFFGLMFLCLLAGVPIALALGGLSAALIYFYKGEGVLMLVVLRAFGSTSSFEYLAIPLFVFMANMLEKSGIAEDLYETMTKLFGRVRGGLAVGTVVICTIFAAMAGVSGAATVSMGILAVPAMLSRGYAKPMALGCVAAGGSLGILIPPSVTMIVYGLIAETSVGQLYAGGVLPGLMLAAMFALYILIRSRLQPHLTPLSEDEGRYTLKEKLASLRGLIFPILLVVGVLGAILTGFTSVSEAAAVGAVGSVVATIIKRNAIMGEPMRWQLYRDAAEGTLLVSCLIFWIIIGASAFSTFYTLMGSGRMIEAAVLDIEVNRYVILAVMMVILIIMGMVIDTVGIMMITVPIFLPIILALGFDPVWFGVLFIINMEIGFLTPPFGYNLFYLRGVVPKNVTMIDIYGSIIPYVLIMLVGLGLCIAFPQIILFLPNLIFRG